MSGYQNSFQGSYGQQAPAAVGAQAGFGQQQWNQNMAVYGQQQTWNTQQQQTMGWTGQEHWPPTPHQENWNNGAPSSRTATPGNNMYAMVPQHIQQPGQNKQETAKRVEGGKMASTGERMEADTYQRTLEYVQQCQGWSSPATGEYTGVMSPDSSSVKGAKSKASPGHSGKDSQVMPPPSLPPQNLPQPGENNKSAQDTGNMVIADMSSSLNTLMEENRYLHMMQ